VPQALSPARGCLPASPHSHPTASDAVAHGSLHPLWHLQVEYSISVQLLEIYNESVRDLLVSDAEARQQRSLQLVNTKGSGANVPDAKQVRGWGRGGMRRGATAGGGAGCGNWCSKVAPWASRQPTVVLPLEACVPASWPACLHPSAFPRPRRWR
jgi:hypothetical protein